MSKKRILSVVIAIAVMISIFSAMAIPVSANEASAYRWGQVTLGGGGCPRRIIPGQNTMYLRTDMGGAYRWENNRWVFMMGHISESNRGYSGTESLAIDPHNDNIVYILTGIEYFDGGRTTIMRSSDGGRTFPQIVDVSSLIRAHGNAQGISGGERLAVCPTNSNVLYAGGRSTGGRHGRGLIRSTDGGRTWANVASFPIQDTNTLGGDGNNIGVNSIVITQQGHIYASIGRRNNSGGNIVFSTDSGSTWQALNYSSGTNNINPNAFFPVHMQLINEGGRQDLIVTLQGDNTNQGGIARINLNTRAVTNISPAANMSISDIAWDPQNPQRMVASTSGRWDTQQSYVGVSGNVWGDRIFRSTNGGTSWTQSSLINMQDGGIAWITRNALHWAGSIAINPQNRNQMHVTSGNGIFSSNNIWDNNPTIFFNPNGVEQTVPLDLISVPGGAMFSAIGDYDGFRHDDLTRIPMGFTPQMPGNTTGIAYNPHSRDVIFRIWGYHFDPASPGLFSTNGGTTWNTMSKLPPGDNTTRGGKCAVTTVNGRNRFIWSPDAGHNITYYSDDNGQNWIAARIGSNNLPGRLHLQVDSNNALNVYAVGNNRLYASTDGGANFREHSLSNARNRFVEVFDTQGKLYIARGGSGLQRVTNAHTASPTFTNLPNVQQADAVGVGRPQTDGPATIFIWGRANNGPLGMYRSTDDGASWIRINDDNNQFGGPGNGEFVIGCRNVFGRVFMSSVGFGIIYGEQTGDTAPVISLTGDHTFPAANEGYAQPAAHTFTVTSTSTATTGAMNVALSGAGANAFTLSATSLPSITSNNGTRTFTVRPIAGLAAGTYNATVTVSGTGGLVSRTATVSFTVNEVSSGNADVTFALAANTIEWSGRVDFGTDTSRVVRITNNSGSQRTVRFDQWGADDETVDGHSRVAFTNHFTRDTNAASVTLANGASVDITFNLNRGNLAAGNYFAGFTVFEADNWWSGVGPFASMRLFFTVPKLCGVDGYECGNCSTCDFGVVPPTGVPDITGSVIGFSVCLVAFAVLFFYRRRLIRQ